MKSITLQKGQLLIAEPSLLGDFSFNRSVLLLTEHNAVEGSIGFILNKPLQYSIHDLIDDIDASFEIYNGGPVEQDNLYFIHTIPAIIPNSIEISNGIYWGGDFEVTKQLINDKKISKEHIRFFLGYTGWGVDQLQVELQEKAWIVTENTLKDQLLSKSSHHFWKEKIMEQGGEYVLFSNAPENPTLN
ncbi:YqgE/AlgH family protein [Flavobacterium sp.]|jgi:putative transcriptional regulator|uniref:YqgE/AlgH family protein n=1 Tax=Flavobacterium sp. TaxID=239 RepID=UPI0037BF1AB2